MMDRPWLKVLVSFHNFPVFEKLWRLASVVTIYAGVVVLANEFWFRVAADAQFHAFFGLILGTLLVFRNNTSYDRWWEGRKLWGQLVNDSRNLAIKVHTLVRADLVEKISLGERLTTFARNLARHLRRGDQSAMDELPEHAASGVDCPPADVAAAIYEQLQDWRRRTLLDDFDLLLLDKHAAAMMDICGGCERIRYSPISPSYLWFIRQSIAIYLLTLPWGLMQEFGWWTVPAVAMLAYFMIGIEMIAEQIENPFGFSNDDLKLDELCVTIEKDVSEILRLPSTGV